MEERPLLHNPEVQNTVIVKNLKEASNVIDWVPISEISAYFIRYPNMLESLEALTANKVNDYGFLHDFGPRLLVRYKWYDNVGRAWRHGIIGDCYFAKFNGPAKFADPEEANKYQPFYDKYYIRFSIEWEITHFAFVLVA